MGCSSTNIISVCHPTIRSSVSFNVDHSMERSPKKKATGTNGNLFTEPYFLICILSAKAFPTLQYLLSLLESSHGRGAAEVSENFRSS